MHHASTKSWKKYRLASSVQCHTEAPFSPYCRLLKPSLTSKVLQFAHWSGPVTSEISTMQTTRLHVGLGSSFQSKTFQQAKSLRSRCTSKRVLPSAVSRDRAETAKKPQPGDGSKDRRGGLGDLLGPIGLTIGGGSKKVSWL